MENNGKGKGYTGEGTSKKENAFPKKDKKSVKAMAVKKIGKAICCLHSRMIKKVLIPLMTIHSFVTLMNLLFGLC